MNRCWGITPQKRPDPGDTGSKAANCRMFKGFGAGHGMMSVRSNGTLQTDGASPPWSASPSWSAAPQTSALAADDDDDNELLDVKIFRGILNGLGLRRDGKAIDYRERSPLVLPREQGPCRRRKTTLRPRRPPIGRTIRTSSARSRRKEAKRNPKPKIDMEDEARCCRARSARSQGPATRESGQTTPRAARSSRRPRRARRQSSAPRISGRKVWAPKEEYQTFTGEPPRTSLIDPPAGYRTPSPNQPYRRRPGRNGSRRSATRARRSSGESRRRIDAGPTVVSIAGSA